jgi:hypothetical protein
MPGQAIDETGALSSAEDTGLRQKRLDGGRQQQPPIGFRIEERLDAERIAGAEQQIAGGIGDDQREGALEVRDRVLTPATIDLTHEVGRGRRAGRLSRELLPQFVRVVEDPSKTTRQSGLSATDGDQSGGDESTWSAPTRRPGADPDVSHASHPGR